MQNHIMRGHELTCSLTAWFIVWQKNNFSSTHSGHEVTWLPVTLKITPSNDGVGVQPAIVWPHCATVCGLESYAIAGCLMCSLAFIAKGWVERIAMEWNLEGSGAFPIPVN